MSDAGSRAYAQRQQHRDDREREELRDTYQRLLLASALRRELGELAKDAGKLAEQAAGSGRVAQTAGPRLAARQQLAAELYALAERFDVVALVRLAELEPADVAALDLPYCGDA